jgi:hypothetical protein
MRVPLLFSMTVAEQAGISHFNLVTLNWAPLATSDMLVPPPFDVKVGFTARLSLLLYSEPLRLANAIVRVVVAMLPSLTSPRSPPDHDTPSRSWRLIGETDGLTAPSDHDAHGSSRRRPNTDGVDTRQSTGAASLLDAGDKSRVLLFLHHDRFPRSSRCLL